MPGKKQPVRESESGIVKVPTGIRGLDEITGGGLPAGRPTLISGSAGAGKTVFALEFLIRGATQFDEPGVFMMFEENSEELIANVRSMGFDLAKLVEEKKIVLDHVHIERSEIEETGEYDLEGLFIRLGHAIDSIGAKRVVLDTLEALFVGLPDHSILRAELRRLFRWLKNRGMTAVITGEKGAESITRYGLEEYVADCVISLDHRVTQQISTRRLRVVKYRGSAHGTNEYPFLIGERGIFVLPITTLRLDHEVPTERIRTGVKGLDEMLGGKGVIRGASILISGSAGTGKSSVSASLVDAACRRGERVLLFAYEESAAQIIRNMKSIGMDLGTWVKEGLLQIHASRPTLHGIDQHLAMMTDTIADFQPSLVAVDPISNLSLEPESTGVKPNLMRLIDYLKSEGITGIFTSLTHGRSSQDTAESSQGGVSSLMDAWLLLRNTEQNGERNRTVYVLKARGMAHSNQVREFILSDKGVELASVYLGANGVLTGTARATQKARERAEEELRKEDHERRLRKFAIKRKILEAQIAMLHAEAEADAAELGFAVSQEALQENLTRQTTDHLALLRGDSRGDLGDHSKKQ